MLYAQKLEELHKEGITIRNGVYTALEHESSTKQCFINLTQRLKKLSDTDDFNKVRDEWVHVIGDKKLDTEESELCLCGMKITNIFYIVDSDRRIAQLGSECIKRIDPDKIKVYKNSQKIKYNCSICDVHVKDKESHLESKIHTEKQEKFKKKRSETIHVQIIKNINKRKDFIKKLETLFTVRYNKYKNCCHSCLKPKDNNEDLPLCKKCWLESNGYTIYGRCSGCKKYITKKGFKKCYDCRN